MRMAPQFTPEGEVKRHAPLWRFCVKDIKWAMREATKHRFHPRNYTVNPAPDTLDVWLQSVPDHSEVSLDIETLWDFRATTQINLSWRDFQAVVFDMEEEYLVPLLRFMKRPMRWVGQNIVLFDTVQLAELGLPMLTCYADTMIANHLLESPGNHDLGFINSHTARDPYWKDEIDKDRHQYACKDADGTRRIWKIQEQRLAAEGMMPLFRDVMKYLHNVRTMKLRGVPVDRELLAKAKTDLENELADKIQKIREATGMRWFNPRSFKDCQEVLYEKLKLPPQYNRKGRVSKVTTDDDALVKLSKLSAGKGIPQLILECRRPANDISKYFRPETVVDGRWFVDWKFHGTETGRYSAWFHTLPPRVRYVVRSPGHKIAYVDAQQGEFRIAAWCAQDKVAMEVQERPGGVHNQNAVEIFSRIKGYKIKIEDVTPMMRFYAKFTTFGWVYGRHAPSVSEQYGIPLAAAEEIINGLNKTYKGIVIWKADTASKAIRTGELRNPYGRRRYFPSGNEDEKEREAYAFIPQSTLHDIVQRAHDIVEKDVKDFETVADMHDALIGVVAPDFDGTRMLELISKEYLPGLRMPFDFKMHDFWYDGRAEEDAKGKVVLT